MQMAHLPFYMQLGVSPDAMPAAEAAFVAILAQVHPTQFRKCELAHGDRCLFDYVRTKEFYHVGCLISCVSVHAGVLMERMERVPLFCDFRCALRAEAPATLTLLLFFRGFMLKRSADVRIEEHEAFKEAAGDVFLSKKEKMAVADMFSGERFGPDDFDAVYAALFCRGQIDPK
jgi:hypothetical protein